ncbi:MAG: hypothetical protein KBA91_01560 [Candidatus Moranbacteria bacterium]|jgi:hypothetical protein|nr:hypothetical protein [Candidatus Moranbacteria bacterium]
MKIRVAGITENPTSLLRRAGYVFQRQENDELSFIRVFSQSGYPRFHCYCTLSGVTLFINLHLDQKKNTYGDATRHHGEYENSPAVEEEAKRLVTLLGERATVIESRPMRSDQ